MLESSIAKPGHLEKVDRVLNRDDQFDCDVVIVGAGLAGLTAAWCLTKQGVSVRVLEAAPHAGGRIACSRLGRLSVDSGAQFWTTAYRVIPALVQELGLAPQIRYVSPETAVLIDGSFHVVNRTRPWSVWRSGLLSLPHSLRLAADTLASGWRDRQRDSSVADPWVDYDVPFEVPPSRRAVRDRLLDPMLNGFYFHGTDTSTALVRAMTALGRGRIICLEGGLGQLSERLAAKLEVQLSTPVNRVVPGPAGVEVRAGQKTWRARQAILSVPATVARNIYASQTTAEHDLLETRYTAGANLTLLCAAGWALPAPLEKVYGVIVPGSAPVPFAALTFERNKSGPVAGPHQINVLINMASSGALLARADPEILRTVVGALLPVLPGIADAIERWAVHRWPEAMPCTPVGRVTAVRDYWRTIPRGRRVWLAGDYMGFPWSDAAAASGERAARAVMTSLRT